MAKKNPFEKIGQQVSQTVNKATKAASKSVKNVTKTVEKTAKKTSSKARQKKSDNLVDKFSSREILGLGKGPITRNKAQDVLNELGLGEPKSAIKSRSTIPNPYEFLKNTKLSALDTVNAWGGTAKKEENRNPYANKSYQDIQNSLDVERKTKTEKNTFNPGEWYREKSELDSIRLWKAGSLDEITQFLDEKNKEKRYWVKAKYLADSSEEEKSLTCNS